MVYQGPAPALDPELPPAVAGPAFLPDGTEVWVRPIHSSDSELVREFVEQESPSSLELRYFSAVRPVLAQEETGRHPPPGDRLCLLVLGDRADRVSILGIGEYARVGPGATTAEVGFLVAAAFHGRGIAALLLARLARAARTFGIARFEARVAGESPELLEVFRGSGLPVHEELGDEEVDVLIPTGSEVGPSGTMRVEPDDAAGREVSGPPGRRDRATGRPRPSALRSRG
ncbi:MAG TPA: GNAT family N-acetyltransferase [Thermoplasmata archaeon]|nr:GNAT family N-acetyltransferase [Thermoplasmata archaeon]